jgi:hypothetical protein
VCLLPDHGGRLDLAELAEPDSGRPVEAEMCSRMEA